MKKIQKMLKVTLCSALMGVLLTGCGSSNGSAGNGQQTAAVGQTNDGTGTTEAVADNSERIQLRIWHGFTSETTKPVIEEIFERYNEVQDEVTIVYDAFSSSDLMQAYTLGAVSGELPDIGTNDNPGWLSLCEMGVFSDINDWYNGWEEHDKIMPSVLASGYYNESVYGVPFGPNCLALWCNTDMLKDAGYQEPPKTFEEFTEVAKATTKPEDGVYGFVMGGMKREDVTFQTMPWLKSAGGDIMNLSSEGSKEAMSMLGALYSEGTISQECLNMSQSDALNQFMAGNAAMYISGSWNVATIRKNQPDLNFTCSPIPAKEESITSLGGELIGITTACKNVEAAEDFLEWFLSYDINKEFCQRCTRFSPRSDISSQDLYPDDEVMAVYAKMLPAAYARGPHPAWSEISSVFQTCCHEIFTNAKDLNKSLEEAALQIEEIDAQYKE